MIRCDGYRNGWLTPRPCRQQATLRIIIEAPVEGPVALHYCHHCKQGILPALLDQPNIVVTDTQDL